MKLYSDNIIRSYQKNGGISKVLFTLHSFFKKQLKDFTVLDISPNWSLNKLRYKIFPIIWIKDNEPHFYISTFNLISLNPKTTNILIVHDLMDELFRPTFKSYIHIWTKFIALHLADTIVCVSNNTEKDLNHLYPKLKQKTRVIYNPVQSYKHQTNKQVIKREKKRFIYIGNRGKFKGFNMVPVLLEILKDFEVLIVGSELTKKEKNELRNYRSKYKLLSNLSDKRLILEIQKSEFLFYPSLYEGFGLPPLEAISVGTKALCGKGGSLEEVCKDKNIFFFEENSISSLKKAAKELLLSDFNEISAIHTLSKFDINKIGRNYIKILK